VEPFRQRSGCGRLTGDCAGHHASLDPDESAGGLDPPILRPDGLERLRPNVSGAGISGPGLPLYRRAIEFWDALECSTPGVILLLLRRTCCGCGIGGRTAWNSVPKAPNVRVVASPLDVLAIGPRSSMGCVVCFFAGLRDHSAGPALLALRPGGRAYHLALLCGCMSDPGRWRPLAGSFRKRVRASWAAGPSAAVMGSGSWTDLPRFACRWCTRVFEPVTC